jgi:hypothetical protein
LWPKHDDGSSPSREFEWSRIGGGGANIFPFFLILLFLQNNCVSFTEKNCIWKLYFCWLRLMDILFKTYHFIYILFHIIWQHKWIQFSFWLYSIFFFSFYEIEITFFATSTLLQSELPCILHFSIACYILKDMAWIGNKKTHCAYSERRKMWSLQISKRFLGIT